VANPDYEKLLRQGLRSISVPEASPDFDAQIHLALAAPDRWWILGWRQVRPVLASAILSLGVSIVVLASTQTPAAKPPRFEAASPFAYAFQQSGIGLVGSADVISDDQDRAR
jgi:hypothetical protein